MRDQDGITDEVTLVGSMAKTSQSLGLCGVQGDHGGCCGQLPIRFNLPSPDAVQGKQKQPERSSYASRTIPRAASGGLSRRLLVGGAGSATMATLGTMLDRFVASAAVSAPLGVALPRHRTRRSPSACRLRATASPARSTTPLRWWSAEPQREPRRAAEPSSVAHYEVVVTR